MEEEPNPNLPTARQAARMRLPEPRHRALRVNQRSQPHGEVNTVAMPWVDFGEDMAAILAGDCVRSGNRFRVQEREYMMEGTGRLYPVAGAGLVQLGRGVYRALGWYNHLGLTDQSERRLEQEKIDEAEREQARSVWRALQAWRQRLG